MFLLSPNFNQLKLCRGNNRGRFFRPTISSSPICEIQLHFSILLPVKQSAQTLPNGHQTTTWKRAKNIQIFHCWGLGCWLSAKPLSFIKNSFRINPYPQRQDTPHWYCILQQYIECLCLLTCKLRLIFTPQGLLKVNKSR